MSDQSLSRDELASALLDGEVAGPSSVDPALAARVEEFRRAADAIGAPVPIDDVVRERAIEAALAEFDAPATSDPADTAPVAGTIATTAAMPRRSRWLPALAGAAAAVVVLIGAVAVLQRDDSSSTDAASVAEQAPAAGASTAATTTPLASPRRARTRRARRRRHRTLRCRPSEISARSPATTSCARPWRRSSSRARRQTSVPTPAKPRHERPSRASSASSPEA